MGERKAAPSPAEERFWKYVIKTEDCWMWSGAKTGAGYGAFGITRHHQRPAHVFAYELLSGPVPDGLELDHLCRNRACVRPDHLEAVTHAENMRRADVALGIRSAAKHCKRGHPLSGPNIRLYRGRRICRACMRFHQANHQAKKRSANVT